jgi:hypothetical protein
MHLYVFHSMLVFSLAAVPLEVRLCSGKGETQALQHSETRDRSRSTGRPLFNHSFSPYPLQAPRTCCANPRRRAPALGTDCKEDDGRLSHCNRYSSTLLPFHLCKVLSIRRKHKNLLLPGSRLSCWFPRSSLQSAPASCISHSKRRRKPGNILRRRSLLSLSTVSILSQRVRLSISVSYSLHFTLYCPAGNELELNRNPRLHRP